MYLNTRSMLFTGIVLAGLFAGLGGFLFFAQMPDAGASREEIFASAPASRQIRTADINRIIAERQALAPRPSSAATAQIVADGRTPLDSRRVAAAGNALAQPAHESDSEATPKPDSASPADEPAPAPPAKAKDQADKKPVAKPSASADDRGGALYRKGDDKAALQAWRDQAEAGDANAAYRLGMEYLTGRLGVIDRDAAEGARWLRFAADRGDPLAQAALGGLYEDGDGVNADKVEALKYYILADSGAQAKADRARRADAPDSPLDRLRAGLSPDEIAEAERRAAAFVPLSR